VELFAVEKARKVANHLSAPPRPKLSIASITLIRRSGLPTLVSRRFVMMRQFHCSSCVDT
jgi:hypothetical protein